jgi:hypothetical protein
MPLAGYSYEHQLEITAPAGGLAAGTVVSATLETRTLIAAGQCQPTRRDFRVTYNGTEIHRVMLTTGRCAFRLQASIAGDATSTAYAIGYGNASEATEPLEDPREVWAFYCDGDDLATLTTSGTVSALDLPRPGFLKVGANPVIRRGTSGQFDYGCIREVELFHDGTYFWACYDAYAVPDEDSSLSGVGLARSTDLLNWEKRGRKTDTAAGRLNDAIIHQLPGQSGLHITWFKHSTNNGSGVPWPPYTLHIATADSVEGTWTDQYEFARTSGGYDDSYNVDGHILTPDGGTTWILIHGASGANGTTAAWARSTTGPLGPYTKMGQIVSGFSGIENPRYLVGGDGHDYVLGNWISPGGYTRSNLIYWNTGGLSFSGSTRLAIVEPGDPGDWDDYAIGVLGMPVIRDGMIYATYDANRAADVAAGGFPESLHFWRDAGAVEAPWPPRWGKGIQFGAAATATTPVLLAAGADGEVRVRVHPGASVELFGAGESFRVWGGPEVDYLIPVNVDVNGSPATLVNAFSTGVDDAGSAPSHSLLLRRSSGTLSIYCQSMLLWEGSSSAALAGRMSGTGAFVEELWATNPLTAPTAIYAPTVSLALAAQAPAVAPRATPFAVPSISVPVSAVAPNVARREFAHVQAASVAVAIDAYVPTVHALSVGNQLHLPDGSLVSMRWWDGSQWSPASIRVGPFV